MSKLLNRTVKLSVNWSLRSCPDPWVLAGLITILVFALAFFLAPGIDSTAQPVLPEQLGFARAQTLVFYWGHSFWALSSFSMQLCLMVVGGYIVALSPPFQKTLEKLACLPQTPKKAVALMAAVSMLLGFFHWGLSVIASALFFKSLVRKIPNVNQALLASAAYLGLGTTWHAGLSASAPLFFG